MDPELQQALNVIDQVCASVPANRAEHQVMLNALDTIRKAVTPAVVLAPAEESS